MNEVTGAPDQDPSAGSGPLFSFLTTAYRSEATLPGTIRSVLSQTRDDWELVVVDNGMSDAIVSVVEPHLTDARIILLRQENRGPLGGVEAAAEVATGEVFVVLNSDDAIVPEFCEVMARALDRYPDVAAVTCDAVVVDARSGVARRASYLQSAGLEEPVRPDRPLGLADVISGPCPYYTAPIRRGVWEAVGGMSMVADAPHVGDLAFWLRLIGEGYDVRTIPDKLGVYFLAEGSVSQPVDALDRDLYSDELEALLARAAESSGRSGDLEALARVRARIHYERAIHRARAELLNGSISEARNQARQAYRARRTVRAAALVVGLRVSPSALVRFHPAKKAVQDRYADLAQRLRAVRVRWRA